MDRIRETREFLIGRKRCRFKVMQGAYLFTNIILTISCFYDSIEVEVAFGPPVQVPIMGSFRNTKWDPVLLISQIVAMQSLLYSSLGALMWFMDLLSGANHTLDHLFQYHVMWQDNPLQNPF